mmetsp:Transcript_9483/g.37035  ORF Transcript_9483/g.37035 Transcript_9483/m.37035 type:complete len:269 (+) Transcript_9483:653-1459(+)
MPFGTLRAKVAGTMSSYCWTLAPSQPWLTRTATPLCSWRLETATLRLSGCCWTEEVQLIPRTNEGTQRFFARSALVGPMWLGCLLSEVPMSMPRMLEVKVPCFWRRGLGMLKACASFCSAAPTSTSSATWASHRCTLQSSTGSKRRLNSFFTMGRMLEPSQRVGLRRRTKPQTQTTCACWQTQSVFCAGTVVGILRCGGLLAELDVQWPFRRPGPCCAKVCAAPARQKCFRRCSAESRPGTGCNQRRSAPAAGRSAPGVLVLNCCAVA